MAIHSQLLQCSASEVHAMVEGAMRHDTDMSVESSYVDSHGASFIGFGITRLLDFDLIARFKQINQMKLYLPGKGDTGACPLLQPALTRPVRWDIIEPQYGSMIKYATAIGLGTASTEAILRRFTKDVTHPAYAAMPETGRAQRTIFLARWLRDRDLQRETSSGLNVVENYNGVNDYIHFGKRGELASNRREEQELSMLCLHILQSSLAFINTLMIQDTLAKPEWAGVRRGPAQADASQAQGPPVRPAPARRTARLRLPQRSLPAPARRTRHRGRPGAQAPRTLPYVPTENEIRRYYQTVWTARRSGDIVLIKTQLYTGVRVAELVSIRLGDVDLDACRIRITRGKGAKDRYVPFPATFKETLALHISAARDNGAAFLFESSWKKPYSTRGVRAMLARYAAKAGLAHNMPPHRLRHFLFTWLKTQGIDDALIQPYTGHATRTSLEIYSRLALADAQHTYDSVIDQFPV